MLRQSTILSFTVLLLLACQKKNDDSPTIVNPSTPKNSIIADVSCEEIPSAPGPFGWNDSTYSSNENITAFSHNPVNPNEFICVVAGDITGYNQLFSYNVVSKNRTILANTNEFIPGINEKGWIVFNDSENNIYMIKSTGDSLRPFSSTKSMLNPQWGSKGTSITYFQQAYFNVSSSIVKSNINGSAGGYVLAADLPYYAAFHNSDQVIYVKTSGTEASLMQKNMLTQTERFLISGPFDAENDSFFFEDLCLDWADQNFFWSNTLGIFRCNLASLKVDTLLKNCPNYTFDNPIISFNPNELTCSMHVLKPLANSVLFHQYKAIRYNLATGAVSEIKLFP